MMKGKVKMEKLLEALPFLIPLIVLQFSLLGYALYHALTHTRYKLGGRPLWILLIVLVNFIGPILYLTLGKEDA
jgi:hypothetical protein